MFRKLFSLPLLGNKGSGRPKSLPLPLARERGDTSPPMICRMIFDEICVLANGEIVCSCRDSAAQRVFGNVYKDRIADIFNGPMYQEMREWQLRSRPDSWCPIINTDCDGRNSRATAVDGLTGRTIKMLQLEPTSYCNLRCPACAVTLFDHQPIFREGRASFLPLEVMLDVVDQLPDLEKILFYNYGEPFLHKEAIPFLREVKRRRPDVAVHTNTNGLLLKPPQIEALASEVLVDLIVFSIDGARPESYKKYRVGGDLNKALRILEDFVKAAKNAGTRERIHIFWQYILFEWNDSDEELALAQELARRIDVPIKWVLTASEGASTRFVDGSAEFERLVNGENSYNSLSAQVRISEMKNHGGIIRGRYLARLTTDRPSLTGPAGARIAVRVEVENQTSHAWKKDRPDAFSVGVRLLSATGKKLRDLLFVPLPPEAGSPGGKGTALLELTLPEEPGSYQLFVDVLELGVCWFSDRGSQPLVCPITVEPVRSAAIRSVA